MAVEVKICGINSLEAAEAAAAADYVGFVFYPPSPRLVTETEAAALAARLPDSTARVGLFVDATDDEIRKVLRKIDLDMLQFHGGESPERVREARATFGLPVIKAVKLAGEEDVKTADAYLDAADRLLFDARPPKSIAGALPGGNALAFDWRLLANRDWPLPWMLSGGLTPENIAEAVRVTGARGLDVSSGVEDAPGRKSPERIRTFLAQAARL